MNEIIELFLYIYVISYIIKIIYIFYILQMNKKPINAIAVFTGKISGTVLFTEDLKNDRIIIDVNLSGLKKNGLHGFHVHEAGDLSDECTSMCAHFNPTHKSHGGPGKKTRHIGDLGNLKTNKDGNAIYKFSDNVIKLRNKYSIIGRGLIIHADEDDCGNGDNDESKKTGNAGKRIACAVIGYSKLNYK